MKKKVSRRSDDLSALKNAADAYSNRGAIGGKPITIPIKAIDVSQNNRSFDTGSPEFIALKESIQQDGLLQRPIVTRSGEETFLCLGGHRRIAALKELGYEKAPCVLLPVDITNTKKVELIRLAENLVREDLKPLEMADSILKAKVELGETATGIARLLEKDRKYISRLVKVAEWPKHIRTYIKDNDIPLISLTKVASKSLKNEEVLRELKKVENARNSSRKSSKSFVSKRDRYFDERNFTSSQRDTVMMFLRDNNVKGWV